MNIQEVRRVVGSIKSSLFKNSNSHAIGNLKSHFKGNGLQYKEHRPYEYGDELKFLDWKVLAKMGKPYIKTFEEERNVEITVVIDVSLSMFTGYKGISKIQMAIEICCLLYLLAEETSDQVRAIILADKVVEIPRASGDKGIIRLVSQLQKMNILLDTGIVNICYRPENSSNNYSKLRAVKKNLGKRKELVFLSDFQEIFSPEELRGNHLHCFQLVGPLDEFKTDPFFVFHTQTWNYSNGQLGASNFVKEKNEVSDIRIKKLYVQDRYLENFVKEML